MSLPIFIPRREKRGARDGLHENSPSKGNIHILNCPGLDAYPIGTSGECDVQRYVGRMHIHNFNNFLSSTLARGPAQTTGESVSPHAFILNENPTVPIISPWGHGSRLLLFLSCISLRTLILYPAFPRSTSTSPPLSRQGSTRAQHK